MIVFMDPKGEPISPSPMTCGACFYSWYDKDVRKCMCDLTGKTVRYSGEMCPHGDGSSSSVGALGSMQPNEGLRADMAYHGCSMDNFGRDDR